MFRLSCRALNMSCVVVAVKALLGLAFVNFAAFFFANARLKVLISASLKAILFRKGLMTLNLKSSS
jgi:hypothetical protein